MCFIVFFLFFLAVLIFLILYLFVQFYASCQLYLPFSLLFDLSILPLFCLPDRLLFLCYFYFFSHSIYIPHPSYCSSLPNPSIFDVKLFRYLPLYCPSVIYYLCSLPFSFILLLYPMPFCSLLFYLFTIFALFLFIYHCTNIPPQRIFSVS